MDLSEEIYRAELEKNRQILINYLIFKPVVEVFYDEYPEEKIPSSNSKLEVYKIKSFLFEKSNNRKLAQILCEIHRLNIEIDSCNLRIIAELQKKIDNLTEIDFNEVS